MMKGGNAPNINDKKRTYIPNGSYLSWCHNARKRK